MRLFAAALLTAGIPCAPALAQGATVSSAVELAREADRLKPGEWVWAPAVAPAGPLLVYVDLSTQRATVYRNGVRIAVSTVSSGKPGHTTPTGVFTILQKDANHHSSSYNNAPMPFTERLTWDGIALHAGGLPGYPESHGCVHLPYDFARALFGITSLGVTVVVDGNAADHVRTTEASLLAPLDARGKPTPAQPLGNADYRWTPDASPAGPVTIIVSKSDQRIVVLRGGVEIGRSAAEIDDDDPGSHVISLASGPDGEPRWTYIGLPGHSEDAGRPVDEAVLNRVHMPRDFYDKVRYDKVRAILLPGATILVTSSRVGAEAGKRITIMDAVAPTP